MFKSDWLRRLRTVLGPFTFPPASRRRSGRAMASRSVQSLEARDLLTVSLSLSAASVSESDDAAARVITLTANSDVPVLLDGTVEISVTGLTASDYSLSDLTIMIPAGQIQGTATLTILNDDLVELSETAVISLINPTGGLIIDPVDGTQLLIVADDDQARLSIDDVAIAEGNSGTTQLVFTVTLDAAVDFATTIDYAVADGTAIAGSDYNFTPGTLSFAANDAVPQTRQFTVDITGDQLVELDETMVVDLLNLNAGGRNVIIADSQAIGTIQNDDQARLSIDDVAITEGNSGTTQLVFTVTLDAAVDFATTIDYAVADGTAIAGSDYNFTPGTLSFAANDAVPQTRQFTVDITGDQLVELDETMVVDLLNLNAGGRNVIIADSQAIGTIQNDDQARLSIDDVAIAEGNSGTTQLVFTVTLDAAVDFATTIDYAVADGTAVAGSDYNLTPGTLSFAANDAAPQTRQFTVNITGDRIVELNETLFANLLNLNAGGRDVVITKTQGLGTILADDSANVAVATSYSRQFEGASVVVAVTVDLAVQGGFDVLVNMTGVGATVIEQAELIGQTNSDYSITLNHAEAVAGSPNTVRLRFNGGSVGSNNAPNLTRSFRLDFKQDTIVEGEEVVRAALGTLTAGMAGLEPRINSNAADDFRDVTILITEGTNPTDSATVILTPVGAASRLENSGPTIFRATLNGMVEGGFQIDGFKVENGLSTQVQRTEGTDDYSFTSVPLLFLPTDSHFVTNGTFADLTVGIVNDKVVELDEQYQVNLGAINRTPGLSFNPATGPTRITTQGTTGTIENDDTLITITRIVADNPSITSVSDYNAQPNAQPTASYSLREAILLSNAARGNQRIVFADDLAAVSSSTFASQFATDVEVATVTLKGPLPTITAPLELTGPTNSRPADMLKILAEKIPSSSARRSFSFLDVAVASSEPSDRTVISGFNFTEANGAGVSAVTVRNSRNVEINTSMFTFNQSTAAPGTTARGAALLIADSTGVNITGSTFYSNIVRRATGTAAYGGAVAVNGTATTDVLIQNSTFFRNDADSSGGALHISNLNATVTLNHVTAADNVAYTAAGAATIDISAAASVAIRNTIVAINNNIRQVALRTVVPEQIIVGNATISNSLVWFPSRSLNSLPADGPQKDPVLSTLQDAGGRTMVMPPSNFLAGFGYRTYQQGTTSIIMSNSPAINKVPAGASGTSVDQRGVSRTLFGNADIGAVEVQAIQSRALQITGLSATAGETVINWATLDGADIIQADRGAPRPGATVAVDIMLTPLDTVANLKDSAWKSLRVNSQPVQLVGNAPTVAGQKLRVRHFLSTPIDSPLRNLELRLKGLPAGKYRVEILGLNADRVVSGMSYAVNVTGTFTSFPAIPSGLRRLDDLFSGPGGNFLG